MAASKKKKKTGSRGRAKARATPRRKTKAKPKRRTSKPKRRAAPRKKETNILSEALKDIERELNNLRKGKIATESKIRSLAQNIQQTQNRELDLKGKIQKLVAREEALDLQKDRLKTKIDRVKEKIQRVTAIGAEMEEID